MQLTNSKTLRETGITYVTSEIYTSTPFGTKIMKELKPYFPGEEAELLHEFELMENMLKFILANKADSDIILECFMETKDVGYTLERSEKNVLSVVELFELKCLLIIMEQVRNILLKHEGVGLDEYIPSDVTDILNKLDPSKDRINTFYIYEEFSEKLPPLRKEKRECDVAVRRILKETKKYLEKEYEFALTPKFELIIPKTKTEIIEKIRQIPELMHKEEDYVNMTFVIKPNEEADAYLKRIDELVLAIEEVEYEIRCELTKTILQNADTITQNCEKMGRLDFLMGKVRYAYTHKCIKPQIVEEHMLEFEDGRNLELEAVLKARLKDYCPVSMSLKDGVNCITGANMGGKTISLKLAGQVQLLAQYGFFVPCKSAKVGLSNFVRILIGDSQSIERGLSSFGSEIEELKDIIERARNRSLILIDEIASGTNPIEGLALTRSIVEYLRKKDYITLMTTHFDNVADRKDICTMQVVGLENADFATLDKEIKYANRKERINIISKYMDYRLKVVESEEEIPKDALHIAKILGLSDEIIEKAKGFMK